MLRGPAPDRPSVPSCSAPSGPRRRALGAQTVPGSRRSARGPTLPEPGPLQPWPCAVSGPARPGVAGVAAAAAAARSHAGRPPASPQAALARPCLPSPGSRGCLGRWDAGTQRRHGGRPTKLGGGQAQRRSARSGPSAGALWAPSAPWERLRPRRAARPPPQRAPCRPRRPLPPRRCSCGARGLFSRLPPEAFIKKSSGPSPKPGLFLGGAFLPEGPVSRHRPKGGAPAGGQPNLERGQWAGCES